ncbi:MAG: hemolysin family protein [Dehalococcoidia bacterium]
MITNALIVLALIVLNGFLSMAELAVLASKRARLQSRAERGSSGARAALSLADEPNRFLSTAQIGITLVGILAGAFGGATLSDPVANSLESVVSESWASILAVAIVVAIITYLSLVAGELVPKRLALRHPEAIASTVARPMQILARVSAPVVWLLSISTDLLLRLLGGRSKNDAEMSHEEIRVTMAEAKEAGVVSQVEHEMVMDVFELDERKLSEIMTPRVRIDWLDLADPIEETLHKAADSSHSRFPVCRENLDEVLGFVSVRDLWSASLKGEVPNLERLVRPAHFLPESMSALDALAEMRRAAVSVALVVDEFGGTQGMVTHADVIEEVVGELSSSDEEDRPAILERDDGSFLVDGMLPFEDFAERFALPEPEEERDFQTVGGLVFAELGRVPEASATFEYEGLKIEVLDMDGRRVDKILVTKQ